MEYNCERSGIVDTFNDCMYVIDDFGNLAQVSFNLHPAWYCFEGECYIDDSVF